MNRTGHENARFFIGGEVELTPAFSKKTLFVVGQQPPELIISNAREHKVSHIFMGANHSFDINSEDMYWDMAITTLLDNGFWVTLDYQAHQHEKVLELLNPRIWQSRLFVPLLSVRIPKFETSNINLTVKIDDTDFKATNPGVWCVHFTEMADSNRFTDWNEYTADVIIEQGDYNTFHIDGGGKVPVESTKMVEVVREKMNNTDLGLDMIAISKLKPENEESKVSQIPPITSIAEAAAAYAGEALPLPKITKKVVKK